MMIKKVLLIFVILIFAFYNILSEDVKKDFTPINVGAEINLDVYKLKSQNGTIINDLYYLGDVTYLSKTGNCNFNKFKINDDSTLKNTKSNYISKPPYKIFKRANSNLIYLVKNQDTITYLLR